MLSIQSWSRKDATLEQRLRTRVVFGLGENSRTSDSRFSVACIENREMGEVERRLRRWGLEDLDGGVLVVVGCYKSGSDSMSMDRRLCCRSKVSVTAQKPKHAQSDRQRLYCGICSATNAPPSLVGNTNPIKPPTVF